MEGLAVIPVSDSSQPAEARRVAMRMADTIGFTETARGQLAIVVTEAATNLLKHAGGGRIILHASDTTHGVEVLAVDSGPGMHDVSLCFKDGYSTAGSSGTGLGAISRLAASTDIYTREGFGTILRAFCASGTNGHSPDPAWDVSAITEPKTGETVAGDGSACKQTDTGILLMVVDGLGHGVLAAQAADAARSAFENSRGGATATVETIHKHLSGTRGAAVAVAEIQPEIGKLRYCGIGNIASVISAGRAQHLVSMNGIAGHQAPRIREFEYSWTPESLLVMHSDGVSARWHLEKYPGLASRRSGIIAAALLRDMSRGTDDATVLVAKLR